MFEFSVSLSFSIRFHGPSPISSRKIRYLSENLVLDFLLELIMKLLFIMVVILLRLAPGIRKSVVWDIFLSLILDMRIV